MLFIEKRICRSLDDKEAKTENYMDPVKRTQYNYEEQCTYILIRQPVESVIVFTAPHDTVLAENFIISYTHL